MCTSLLFLSRLQAYNHDLSRSLLYLRRFSPPCLSALLCNLSMMCLLLLLTINQVCNLPKKVILWPKNVTTSNSVLGNVILEYAATAHAKGVHCTCLFSQDPDSSKWKWPPLRNDRAPKWSYTFKYCLVNSLPTNVATVTYNIQTMCKYMWIIK